MENKEALNDMLLDIRKSLKPLAAKLYADGKAGNIDDFTIEAASVMENLLDGLDKLHQML